MTLPLPQPMQLEHDIATVIAKQQVTGWEFDYPAALALREELEARKQEIYELVRPHLVMERETKKAPVLNPWKKDGSAYLKRVLDYWGHNEAISLVDGAYTPVEYSEPDIGSRQKLMKQLERHGWKHVNLTDKGNPKLDEESLEGLDLGDTGNLLMEYFKCSQRSSTLLGAKGTGWLTKAYQLEGTDRYRITAGANPCGTNTHRMTHRDVVNVPKADPSVYYGKQMRSLYKARPGMKLLGADASQLEFRCALSYMNALEMIEMVDDPDTDIHQVFYEEMSEYMESRNSTKNVVYASIFEATDKKLTAMADFVPKGSGDRVGHAIKQVLLKYMPDLDNFTSKIKSAASKGYLIGIDGMPIYIRRKEGRLLLHTAVNTLLQQCGSMVVKRATVYLDQWTTRDQLTWYQNGMFHDEVQGEVYESEGPAVGELFIQGLKQAGKDYNLSCPMDGEYKIGENWSQTH